MEWILGNINAETSGVTHSPVMIQGAQRGDIRAVQNISAVVKNDQIDFD